MAARDDLLSMVLRLVSGDWTVPAFEQNFYHAYLDTTDDTLSDADHEFFGYHL